jgi:hypothetical protein
MTGKVLRDRKALPALDALLARTLDSRQAELVATLTAGFGAARPAAKQLRALIPLALDFWTWQRLTREGLDDDAAAKLMGDLVAQTAARDGGRARGR